eukprot:scaffold5570_cov72-Cyclotella_meneghiniana.AAC.4
MMMIRKTLTRKKATRINVRNKRFTHTSNKFTTSTVTTARTTRIQRIRHLRPSTHGHLIPICRAVLATIFHASQILVVIRSGPYTTFHLHGNVGRGPEPVGRGVAVVWGGSGGGCSMGCGAFEEDFKLRPADNMVRLLLRFQLVFIKTMATVETPWGRVAGIRKTRERQREERVLVFCTRTFLSFNVNTKKGKSGTIA